MRKWLKECPLCPYIKEGPSVKGANFTWKLNGEYSCQTENIIYMIECNKEKCQQRYIGETDRGLIDIISEHIGYIRTKKLGKATGYHFNLPGHSVANMTVTVLEKVKKK